MRTQLMIEDGEITSIFNQGKGPSIARPAKPENEVQVPKILTAPSTKPKIKTGNLKPKPKVRLFTNLNCVVLHYIGACFTQSC